MYIRIHSSCTFLQPDQRFGCCVSITKSWASQQPEVDPGGSPQDRGLKQLESRKNSLSWPSHVPMARVGPFS